MTELESLKAGILEFPDCDTRRGIYADALQETEEPGHVAYAEFIRVQIELAGITYRDQTCRYCRVNCGENKAKYCRIGGDPDGKNSHRWENPRRNELKQRERELWEVVQGKFFAHTIAIPLIDPTLIAFMNPPGERSRPIAIVRRGFVSGLVGTLVQLRGVTCPDCLGARRTRHYHQVEIEKVEDCEYCAGTGRVERLLEHLMSVDPITNVMATDKRPAHRLPYGKEMWTWFGPPPHTHSLLAWDEARLPDAIWQALPRVDYDTREEAEIALGRSLLDEAKEGR